MADTVTIYCKNTKQYYDIQRGTSLMALKEQIGIHLRYPIIAARVICQIAGVELSDTMERVFGGAELVAVAAMAYTYMRWRQQQQ